MALTHEEHRDIQLGNKLEKFSPLLSFRSPKSRRNDYLIQVSAQASIVLVPSVIFGSFFLHPLIGMFLAFLVFVVLFVYLPDLGFDYGRGDMLRRLKTAAAKSFANNGNIELSGYIRPPNSYGFGSNKDFVGSLTPRQLRWIERKYKKEEALLIDEKKNELRSFETNYKKNAGVLNSLVDEREIKKMNETLRALKELQKDPVREHQAIAEEELFRELDVIERETYAIEQIASERLSSGKW